MSFRIKTLLTGILAGLAMTPGLATDLSSEELGPEPQLRTIPNVELPDYVPVEPGKLQLFADFGHPGAKGIPIYLVNRTREAVPVLHQDGNIFVKLERQLADGTWERVQSHTYSDCGNSYGTLNLPPGMFFLRQGYQVQQGEPATVRYASYGKLDIVSNAAPGLIEPAELQTARLDRMSVKGFPHEIAYLANLGFSIPAESGAEPAAPVGRYSGTSACFELARVTGGLPAARAAGERWTAALAALRKPNEGQTLALMRMREILSQPWPEHPSIARLMDRCLASISATKAESSTAGFGTPEKEIRLAWIVLAACRDSEVFFSRHGASKVELPDPRLWKTVMNLAAARATRPAAEEVEFIAPVLGLAPQADEYLPSSVFEDLLASSHPRMVRVAAVTLARRQQWSRMVKLAEPLPMENQLIIFESLTGLWQDGHFRNLSQDATVRSRPEDPAERRFWEQVVTTQPLQVCRTLEYSTWDENPFNRAAFEGLLSYWEEELDRSRTTTRGFPTGNRTVNLLASVRFIAGWKYPDDLPLLRGMLKYRGYRQEEYTEGDPPCKVVKRVFQVRREAADALMRRGEPLPQNLIFETEISRTPIKRE